MYTRYALELYQALADNTASNPAPLLNGGAIFATGTSPAISDPWCWIQYCDFWNNSLNQFVGISDPTTPPPPTSCTQTNFAVNPLFTDPANCVYSITEPSLIGAYQAEDPPVSVAGAKQIDNGVIVEISGVFVRTYSAPVQIGQLVDVTGTMSEGGIEREVVNPTITIHFGPAPRMRRVPEQPGFADPDLGECDPGRGRPPELLHDR